MHVTIGQPKSIIVWRTVSLKSEGSITLRPNTGESVVLTSGIRVNRNFVEFVVPGEYITPSNLPMKVEMRMNGRSLSSAVLESDKNMPSTGIGPVVYNNGWPQRPTSDSTQIITWIGGSPSNPPPGISGVDIWMVPTA